METANERKGNHLEAAFVYRDFRVPIFAGDIFLLYLRSEGSACRSLERVDRV